MTWTDKSKMMTSHQNCKSQSHKGIAQRNHTKEDDVTSKNGNDKKCFWMLQSNSGAYGVTKYVQVEGLDTSKLHVKTLDG